MKQPETRTSLLLRIRDPQDLDSWAEFSAIYRPAIFRLARRKGLQNADAEDLAQQVLLSVAGAIAKWKPDRSRGRFRTWLNRVTHNAVINAITRAKPDRASGNTAILQLIDQSASSPDDDGSLLRLEIKREMFQFAAAEIRSEFQDVTWQSFWLTAVMNKSVDDVAKSLSRNRGSIYAARSRVMRRLKDKIRELGIIDEAAECGNRTDDNDREQNIG